MHADSPADSHLARAIVIITSWSPPSFIAFIFEPAFIAGFVSLLIFLTTIQTGINGSSNPYATDIGEIQNGLPRWGTLHFTGYPQYTFLGSLFVTILRLLGIAPALGSSLYSALWGALSISFLVAIMQRLAVPAGTAVITALLFAISTSMWIDASIAELHTMTLALMLGILWAAIDFHRHQHRSSLFWLAFLSSNGFSHQRSVAFMGLGLLILILPHWRMILTHWRSLLLLTLTGPLTYLYLPIRAWMGADWIFSAPGTWEGFWTIILDTKAERIISLPESLAGWQKRIAILNDLLAADWPWLLLLPGLLALLIVGTRIRRTERIALTLVWLAFYGISLIVWEGRVSDALLAVKMPVTIMASIGLGLIGQHAYAYQPRVGQAFFLLWVGCALWLFVRHQPQVFAITRDPAANETITIAKGVETLENADSVTLMGLWGNDFWQMAYAQRYGGCLPSVTLVDHNADFGDILARGDRLLTLSRTFYQSPLSWWERELSGPLFLDAPVPGLIELATDDTNESASEFELDNGIGVSMVDIRWADQQTLWIQLTWLAPQSPLPDYSVAVHLLRQHPVTSPDDLIAQADRSHPVDGWYPVSRWSPGEAVEDAYSLDVPAEVTAQAVRISMYQAQDDGSFANTNWLTFDLPPRPESAGLFQGKCE